MASPGSACAWIARVGDGALVLDVRQPGAKPQLATDGSCSVVLDGTLRDRDNFDVSRDSPDSSDPSDAALILGAYRRGGEASLGRVRGVFTLVVWDGEKETLHCVRDPLGVHPLFYAEADGSVLVSPGLRELLDEPSVSRRPNRPWLAEYLVNRPATIEETFFEAVRRVPPGHVVKFEGGRRRSFRYWDPDDAGAQGLTPNEVVERFEALVLEAVAHLLGGKPAGVCLSGGLDSPTTAAAASEVSRKLGLPPPWALCLAFPPPADETDRQREVASALGMPQLFMRPGEVGTGGLLRATLELAAGSPLPPVTVWAPAWDELTVAGAQRGCSVILTSDGGDDWLFFRGYAADLLRALDVSRLYTFWKSYRAYFAGSDREALEVLLWTFGLRQLVRELAHDLLLRAAPVARDRYVRHRRMSSLPPWLAPDPQVRRALVERSSPEAPNRGGFGAREKREALSPSARLYGQEYLFLRGRERGVEIRDPFLETGLVEFLYQLPLDVLARYPEAKWLARRFLQRRLPPLPTPPKKVSFGPYADELFQADGLAVFHEARGARLLGALGVVDETLLREGAEKASQRRTWGTEGWPVWTAVVLDTWLQVCTI